MLEEAVVLEETVEKCGVPADSRRGGRGASGAGVAGANGTGSGPECWERVLAGGEE